MRRILLEKAEVDLRIVRFCLGEADDMMVQSAAYHVQQAVEKCLKQVYVENGVSYNKIHDIGALIMKLPTDTLISDDTLEAIEDVSDSLTVWESKTRYDDPYMAKRSKVVKVYALATKLYQSLCRALKDRDEAMQKEEQIAEVREKAEGEAGISTTRKSLSNMDLFS